VGNACERVLHELTAVLAHRPTAALLQLDYKNAFNLMSLPAAVAYLSPAFPLLRFDQASVYLAAAAPRVYGWAADGDGGGGAAAPLARLWLRAERGRQQGDPLGPHIHTAAMQVALRRLAAAHPTAVVRSFHDEVVVVAEPTELSAVLQTTAVAGAAVAAELTLAKCVGWSPAGAPAPAGWPARWSSEGVLQFSVPVGTDAFMASAVNGLAAEQARLVDAVVALSAAELQSQILLLRLCAGPRPNYWLRALPLEWALDASTGGRRGRPFRRRGWGRSPPRPRPPRRRTRRRGPYASGRRRWAPRPPPPPRLSASRPSPPQSQPGEAGPPQPGPPAPPSCDTLPAPRCRRPPRARCRCRCWRRPRVCLPARRLPSLQRRCRRASLPLRRRPPTLRRRRRHRRPLPPRLLVAPASARGRRWGATPPLAPPPPSCHLRRRRPPGGSARSGLRPRRGGTVPAVRPWPGRQALARRRRRPASLRGCRRATGQSRSRPPSTRRARSSLSRPRRRPPPPRGRRPPPP